MKVCKFKPITSYRDIRYIKELLNGKLHLSDWTKLNDIWEGVYRIAPSRRSGGCAANINYGGDKLYKLKRRFGVFSFSCVEKNGRNILMNHCMWAHYASNHSGVAVVYEIPDDMECYLHDVDYGRSPMTLSTDEVVTAESGVQKLFELAQKLLSSKTREWECEQELRLIVDLCCSKVEHKVKHGKSGNQQHDYFLLGNTPKRVVTGSRYFENEAKWRNDLESACERRGIEVVGVSELFENCFLNEDDLTGLQGFFFNA